MRESIDAERNRPKILTENFQTTLINLYWKPFHTFVCGINVDLLLIGAFMCCQIHWGLCYSYYTQHLSVAHVKAKQHISFMGRDHSPHLVCRSQVATAQDSSPGTSRIGSTRCWADGRSTQQILQGDVLYGCAVVLLMCVWWQGSSASKISPVLPFSGILCMHSSFIKTVLIYILGKIPQKS